MRYLPPLLLTTLLLLHISSPARADEVHLRCTADTNVSSYDTEREMNYGHSPRLRLKGIEMLALMDFDLAPVKGWKVDRAELYLRYAGGDSMLRTIGFSTVSAPWEEGTGSATKEPGQSCFAWREQGKTRWAGPQTDFTDVTFTAGNTIAAYADIRDRGNGWFSVEVDPRIVQCMIAGVSYGMAVSDEKGQTRANNDIFSREQSGSEPYLVVAGTPIAARKSSGNGPLLIAQLSAAPDPRHADFEHGAIAVSLTPQASVFAFRVGTLQASGGVQTAVDRYRIPLATPGRPQTIDIIGLPPAARPVLEVTALDLAGRPVGAAILNAIASPTKQRPRALKDVFPLAWRAGFPLENEVKAWIEPDTAKLHPVTGNDLDILGPSRYPGRTQPTTGNMVNLRGDVTRPAYVAGARNEIVALQVIVDNSRSPLHGVSLRVAASGEQRQLAESAHIYRLWYVKQGAWYPEACVPLTGPVDVPTADNGIPNQQYQAFLIELLIPRNIAAGKHSLSIEVSADGKRTRSLPVELTVYNFTFPDTLSFDISLNTYGTVGGPFGIDDRTAEYRALEREYHRMAHAHRATLAALGYSHSGRITSNYAPPLGGDGAGMRVTDWSSWDAQFGPYLDGSAFKGLPRDGVPLAHLYLPFHEDWPGDIRKHYHYTPTVLDYPATISEHAMKAPPIEQAMDRDMADAFTAITKQFAEHFKEKGWTRTMLQFYQNDKHYYKDPKMGGQGTSWWLLDEPNHRDDWLALVYFARLFRAAMKAYPGVPMVFREDISRPQWQRDYLDGLVDLMVVGGEMFNKVPRLREMREKLDVRYWTYGTANEVKDSNLQAEAWAIRAWLAGADAIVPWQSVGGDENYTKPDATALLLPGKRFGIIGPIASLRLKALRRAQQDVEYLVAFSKAKGFDRDQVAAAIAPILHLDGAFQKANDEDAGVYRFEKLDPAAFESMRRAIGTELSRK